MAHRQRPAQLRAFLAAITVLLATAMLHTIVRHTQSEQISSIVQTFTDEFSARLEEQFRTRFQVVEMIRTEWETGRISSAEDFSRIAGSLHDLFDDLQALNWVNAQGVIERVTPLEGNERALGLNILALDKPARALKESSRLKTLRLTSPIELAQGGAGFVGYAPVFENGEPIGHINLVFRILPVIEKILGRTASSQFVLKVADQDAELFSMHQEGTTSSYGVSRQVEMAGRTWTVTVMPKAELVDQANSFLDEAVLLLGITLAVFIPVMLVESASNKKLLADREERFSLAMEGASDGLFDMDVLTFETYFSPRWYQMLGYAPDELPAKYDTFLSLLHPDDVPRFVQAPDEFSENDLDTFETEFRMRHKDGSWISILSRARIVRRKGRAVRIVGTHVDMTEMRKQQRALEKAAVTDDLTGLRNRRGLAQTVRQEYANLNPEDRLCLMHIDLDHFKAINDRDGHEAGDFVLCAVAARIKESMAGFQVIARVGGDEFMVAWKTSGSNEAISDAAAALICAIELPIEFSGKMLRVGASIGIAFVDAATDAAVSEAVSNADIALKTAKASGRGNHVFFRETMRDETLRRLAMASEIREGLENDEFVPFLQPQVELRSNRIIGFEALARWKHPTRGVLSAGQFVSVAEQAHLIETIDDRIFAASCKAVAAIDALGLEDATISINLSTAQLMDSSLVERLLWTVDMAPVDPSRICIELLECTLLSERVGRAVENIRELAAAGFKIELDDFGTGHTAIASLRNFPVSRIKIDRSLVSGVDQDRNLQAIATSIVDLGSKLGIEVLAEGIETEQELQFFASTACSHAQGYLVSKPVAIEDLADWVRRFSQSDSFSRSHNFG